MRSAVRAAVASGSASDRPSRGWACPSKARRTAASTTPGTSRDCCPMRSDIGRSPRRPAWRWLLVLPLVWLLVRNFALQYFQKIPYRSALLTNLGLLALLAALVVILDRRPVLSRRLVEGRGQALALIVLLAVGTG